MMQKIWKLRKSRKGFTLVEIIVVLVILAILAAFTIPAMLGFVQDARKKAYLAEAREVYVAAQSTVTELNAASSTNDANTAIAGLKAWKKGYGTDSSTTKTTDTNAYALKMQAYLKTDVSKDAKIADATVDDNGNVTGLKYQITGSDGRTYVMTLTTDTNGGKSWDATIS